MRTISATFLPIVLALFTSVWGLPLYEDHPQDNSNSDAKISRSTNTCADPSLARPIFQAFNGPSTIHLLNVHYAFVASNTLNQIAFWTDQHPAFLGWTSQQPFTVPLFQLGNAARTEYIFMIGPDSKTAPIVSGFNTDVEVIAWVYNTPVCGSVPLLSLTYAPLTDHYYTTDADEHAGMIAGAGWTDTGVIAYVLPLQISN